MALLNAIAGRISFGLEEYSGVGRGLRRSRKYILTDGESKGLTTQRAGARMTLNVEHVTALGLEAHVVAGLTRCINKS